METAATDRQPSNADVLPLIEKLGDRPAALGLYDDFHKERGPDGQGLKITFSFNGHLEAPLAREALRYCANAFNVIGFKADPAQADTAVPAYAEKDGVRQTSVTLRIPAEGMVTSTFVQVEQRDFQKREILHTYENVEAEWRATRVIRQAAMLG